MAEADAGTARVAGADVRAERDLVRRRIAVTGQFTALDDLQTGRENLRMMGRLARLPGREADARADELLDRFDLQDVAGRRVSTYSGGLRRRLDLAVSLLIRPAVIFLDEPTTGLDPRSRQQMWTVVGELAGEGTTVFLTTQYLEEADRLADRIAVLDGGRLVAEGTATELKARVGGFRLDLTAAGPAAWAALLRAVGPRAVMTDAATRTVGIGVDGDAAAVRVLLDELDPTRKFVTRFAVHSASLDDVFLTLTGHCGEADATTEKEAIGV